MELPNTSASVGMPSDDSRVMLRKVSPPGMKPSAWVRRSAPPDSTSCTIGIRFCSATSIMRSALRQVCGLEVPPLTVGSAPPITHSTPSTGPMPATIDPPTL